MDGGAEGGGGGERGGGIRMPRKFCIELSTLAIN